MKLKEAIQNLGQANSIATASNIAQELNIQWEGGVSVVFSAIANDLDRVPGNIGGTNDNEEAVIKKWILKFQKGREGRPSLRESNLPGTVADPIIEKIIGARIAALTSQELNQITYAHRLSMSAENILGLILEEYLAVNLDEHGWYCAWGGTVKHVDFVHKGGRLLQIKNRSNSENSASAGARDGTEIIKWFRIKAARIEYMWAALNEICGTNCLSEEDFVDFVQTTITNNPGCLGVEQNNPWS